METPAKVAALEFVETCFVRLYRDEEHVFKLRKPVVLDLGGERVDWSSRDARRLACLEEARLDDRLAPDFTLGVVPLVRDGSGERRFGGEGEVEDWALHMRRLPDAERADRRLLAGTLTDEHLRAVARRLAAAHEPARGEADGGGRAALAGLRNQALARPRWVGEGRPTPLPPEVEQIEARQLERLEALAPLLHRRAASEAIREGHGELTLEHVFLDEAGNARLLAGLEVSPRMRCADVAADVAFLATDLAARHRADLAERFVAEYARIANDFDLYPLLDLHASLRAGLRGKLAWLCADRMAPEATIEQHYRERARRCFALALAAPQKPLLPAAVVVMGGQVASGKSTVARHIARRIGAPVVSSDATRDFLLGARLVDPQHEVRWDVAYAPGFGERVYREVLRRAEAVLSTGRPVVIDGCFRSREQRRRARDLAEAFGRPFLFVEARVDRDVQRRRLAERAQRDAVPLADWVEIADALRAEWEPEPAPAGDAHLALDTALPLDENADAIEARLPTWPAELTG